MMEVLKFIKMVLILVFMVDKEIYLDYKQH